MNQIQPHHFYAFIMILIIIIFAAAGILVRVLFSWSVFKTAKRIPQEHHLFPAWFCWLMIIPIIGIVFDWMMLPFGVPWSAKKYFEDNEQAKQAANVLFGIGLAYAICISTVFIPILNFITGIGTIVLWIIYWVKIVNFRKEF